MRSSFSSDSLTRRTDGIASLCFSHGLYEFDEQDVALGMDNVYVERNDQIQSGYGGVERVELHPDRVRVLVAGPVAEQIGDGEFEIHFTLSSEEFERLRAGLAPCFRASARCWRSLPAENCCEILRIPTAIDSAHNSEPLRETELACASFWIRCSPISLRSTRERGKQPTRRDLRLRGCTRRSTTNCLRSQCRRRPDKSSTPPRFIASSGRGGGAVD